MALTGPPTWWDKAVGFRNKEGDKFPTVATDSRLGVCNKQQQGVGERVCNQDMLRLP